MQSFEMYVSGDKMTDAIILAGGDGKRLGLNIPKALIPIGGKTLLQRQIEYLKQHSIRDIGIAVKEEHLKLFQEELSKAFPNEYQRCAQ